MPSIPLICPRCGKPQRFVPGGPGGRARVVHEETGREDCGPGPTVENPPPAEQAGD
ncbi:hypothetical protein ABT095_04270 [Kitasatospora sp. NPDC002227]|uniref:hypothetical protein n=1 Tax=Kitasatospora sp. NPDC002227 TaxID=3154773 RepID=UPI00331EDFA5